MEGASPCRMEMQRNQVSLGPRVAPMSDAFSGVIFCRMLYAGNLNKRAGDWSRHTHIKPSVEELKSMSEP
eukprot:1538226-Amphidinium_carterae.1